MPRRRFLFALVVSLLVHLLPAAPALFGAAPELELEPTPTQADQDGAGPAKGPPPEQVVPAEAFHVSVYEEPVRAASTASAPLPSPVALVPPTPADAPPEPPPEPSAEPEPPPEPEPPLEVPPEVPPEPPAAASPEALEAEALAQVDADPTLIEPSDLPPEESLEPVIRGGGRRGRGGAKAHTPCPTHPSVVEHEGGGHWTVDRALIDFYAGNLRAFAELGRVWTHKGPDGKLDGVRVGLPRCSVLKQAGLRHGDIVHDVNGRRFYTVLQGVAAYIALRTQKHLTVHVTRGGAPVALEYTIDHHGVRGGKARRDAAKAAGAFRMEAAPPNEPSVPTPRDRRGPARPPKR